MRVLPLLLACCIVSVASAAVRVCPRPQQLPSSCGCIERQDTRIVIVTHGPTADGYWTSINEGITTAADRFGIQVEHLAPTRYELAFGSGLKATMGKLLQRAIDLKPDGVILSIPDNSIVKDSLAALASAGISVMSMNSGYNTVDAIPLASRPLIHIGQDEVRAGQTVAQELIATGARRAVCINDDITDSTKALRCKSFDSEFERLNGTVMSGAAITSLRKAFQTSSQPTQAKALNAVMDNLTDAMVTLSSKNAIFVQSIINKHARNKVTKHATFEVSAEVYAMLDRKELEFTIDQQPFLQGFLPVMFMTTFKTSLMKAQNSKLRTGPAIVRTRPSATPMTNYNRSDITIKTVTHGKGLDNFWDVVYGGAQQGAADMGVTIDLTSVCDVKYKGDDPMAMARYINASLANTASLPDGLMVSIPDASILGGPIMAATKAGVPVISLNSGYNVAAKLGALTHVGQTEYEAGEMAGQFFINRGVKSGLCLVHEQDNSGHHQRCGGFKAALTSKGLKAAIGNIGHKTDVNIKVLSPFLLKNSDIDGVLVLGPNLPAMINAVVDDVKTKPGQANRKILTGTFDYSPQIGAMITKGDLLFGIHQQQFYQGYLPVVLLTLKKTRGLVVQEPIVFTGPAFVTAPQVEARKCELAPVCKTASIKNDQYVLRAKFSMNTIAMRFATSSFTPVMNTSAAISSYSAVAVSVPRDGCTPFINARTVVDRFVLIEEGGCFFATKVQYATQAGAKGVIITRKTSATPVTMKSRTGLNGTIPAIMVSFTDGNRLRADKDATTVRITPFVITCPKGYREVNFECQPCPEGTYQDKLGAKVCEACPSGTYSSTVGAASRQRCSPCQPGTYQDQPSQQQCKKCDAKSFSSSYGAVTCQTCPANNVTGTLVIVSKTCGLDSRNGKVTETCDSDILKTNADQCFCVQGFLGNGGKTCEVCPVGASCCNCKEMYLTKGTSKNETAYDLPAIFKNLQQYGRPCASCLAGSSASKHPPIAKPGYFESKYVPNKFLPCSPAEVCLGGPHSVCKQGHAGFRCGECAPGFYSESNECTPCPETPFWLMLLAFTLAFMFCLYALNAVSRWFRSGALAICVDWAQTTAIFSSFPLLWPKTLDAVEYLLSLVLFETDFFAPECSVKVDYWEKWALNLMLPFMVTVLFVLMYTIARTKYKYSGGWSENHASAVTNAYINAFLMFLSVIHPFLTKTALEVFRCREYADGRSYLDAKPSLMCYSDEWYSRMPFAVLSFLLYGCGIPVLFFTVLYVNRTQLDTRHIKRRYGSIFLIYKKDCWYWETWMKVKKLFVMLSLNIFPEETTYQAILALIVLEIGIHLNGKHQPFRFSDNNKVQRMASVNSLFFLFSGLMFYSEKLDEWGTTLLATTVITMTAVTGVNLIRAVVGEFLAYYGHWLIKKHRCLESFLFSSIGQAVFSSRAYLSKNTHWAKTEDLLDKYSKSQAVNKSNPGAANIQQDAIKAGRRRSLVECGDVGQSLNPDSKQLHKLFFREDALSVVSMWEKIHAQELDMKDLTRILLLIKGAGELEHMKQEMDKNTEP